MIYGDNGYSLKATLPIGYLFRIYVDKSFDICNNMMVCGYTAGVPKDYKAYYENGKYTLTHKVCIGGYEQPHITTRLDMNGNYSEYLGSKCYIVKPLNPQRFQELLCAIDPNCVYSIADIARFCPRVENEPWFSSWINDTYIPEDKVIRPITGAPELLWPFLQNVPEEKILDRVAMFNMECEGKIEFPLDMNLVECILLMGEKVKLIVGKDIVREGNLKVRQLDGYYQLI